MPETKPAEQPATEEELRLRSEAEKQRLKDEADLDTVRRGLKLPTKEKKKFMTERDFRRKHGI